MRYTAAQLTGMIDAAFELPAGEGQIAQLREVVRHAEATGLTDVLVDARLMLVQAMMAADPPDIDGFNEIIAAFIRLLALYTAEPARFADDQEWELWRQFGLLGIVLVGIPNYPLGQVRGVLDDMERRARPGRDDLYTVWTLRAQLAGQLGDRAGLDECRERLRPLHPAEYLCGACLTYMPVACLAYQGRHEEAITATAPLLTGEIPCVTDDFPRRAVAALIVPYLRTGRFAEARDAHLRSYRSYRWFLDFEDELAAHLTFCALTGNEERGLEIFRQHLEQLGDRVLAPSYPMGVDLMAAAALLCRRLVVLGRGAEVFLWPGDPDDPEGGDEEWTFAELVEVYTGDALTMAGRHDERNGSTYVSDRVRALIGAEPVCDRLPLTPSAPRRTVAADPSSEATTGATISGYGAEARLSIAVARAERGARALAEGRAREAADELAEAVAEYTALGDPRAAYARVDLADAYLRLDRWLDAAECAEEVLPALAEPDDDRGIVGKRARRVLVTAYPHLGQRRDALRTLHEMVGRETDEGRLGRLYEEAGTLLTELDEPEDAARQFVAAAEAYERAGDLFELTRSYRRAALARYDAGEPTVAADLLDEAGRAVDRLPPESHRTSRERAVLDYESAPILAATGRHPEALRRVRAAIDAFQNLDDDELLTKAEKLLAELAD